MRKNFKDLKARMSPESRARAGARTREMMADMLLGEVRRLVGLTQEDLAKKLGIAQPTLSRLESQDDMQISTLRRLITGLGGSLELLVHLPTGDLRINQFEEPARK